MLTDFAAAVNAAKKNPSAKPNGALLFSVVGKQKKKLLPFTSFLKSFDFILGKNLLRL